MAELGKYLYCVVKEGKSRKFNITGQEKKKVYTVNQGDLAIAVSDTSKDEYLFIKEHLADHQKVIEKVMIKEGYDVLPVRFNTVAKSVKDVKEKILKAKRKELLKAFPLVEGRVELGLRMLWKDMPSIFREIVTENKEVQAAKKQAHKSSNHFKVARVGELVQKALDLKRETEAEKIFRPLKKIAVDFKARELKRHPEVMKDSMICSSAFLVSRKKEKEFDKKVKEIVKKYDQRVKFIYVGPIPPFNFVELILQV